MGSYCYTLSPDMVKSCQILLEKSHQKGFLWPISGSIDLDLWPPDTHSWSFHAHGPLLSICINIGSFVVKISHSQVWQWIHRQMDKLRTRCHYRTVCGLVEGSIKTQKLQNCSLQPWSGQRLLVLAASVVPSTDCIPKQFLLSRGNACGRAHPQSALCGSQHQAAMLNT